MTRIPVALMLGALALLPAGCSAPRPAGADDISGAAADTGSDRGVPRWIWTGVGSGPRESLVFRKSFVVAGPVARAEIVATCDNELRLLLDGEERLHSATWEVPVAVDVTAAFADKGPRRHELSVSAENEGGPGGLLVQLRLERPGEPPLLIVSDSSWEVADDSGEEQPDDATDAGRTWRPAVEVGSLGSSPWTHVTARLLATAPLRRQPVATPVEQIHVPPGFVVELLYSPSAEQGSWVSVCVDPAGRLIVSDQYEAGLYRITLPDGPVAALQAPPSVERIDLPLSGAQGLLWAFDSLYALVGSRGALPGGLYRMRDSDDDDRLDTLECLRELQGGGEHGWHALLATPDGEALYAVAGNDTTLTELAASRVPRHWGEDQLLPRLPDASGSQTNVLAPGGCIYRVSPDGQRWELLSIGYRNAYDAALDADGELFTFDSDMEWDMNTPWYRPTRLCLVASGSDYGWRNGSGKFPARFADTLPPVLELGPGSPVGMCFGAGTAFPERWRSALFLGDWSYGRVQAVHLEPDGAGFAATSELFMTGTPLPVTDLLVRPQDGALYLITGGRDVQGGLYRVRWSGGEDLVAAGGRTAGPVAAPPAARATRQLLEELHAHPESADLDTIWAQLGSADRFVRHAARIALEWQPVADWSERALAEHDPQAAITALLALARSSGRDAPHREVRARMLEALARLSWSDLDADQRLELLRALSLVFTRLGAGDEAERSSLVARWSPLYPSGEPHLDADLCALLAFLQDDGLAAKAVPRLQSVPTQEEQMDVARCLRVLQAGWTESLRQDYFAWFQRASAFRGGNSFAGFVRAIRADALGSVPDAERAVLTAELGQALTAPTPLAALQGTLAGRRVVQHWTLDTLLPAVELALARPDPAAAAAPDAAADRPPAAHRDLLRGRQLFGAVGCFACHRVDGEGGSVGPDLTSVGQRFALPDLLSAIVDPSALVSDQYRLSRIDTFDGQTFIGHIVDLSGDTVFLSEDLFRPSERRNIDRGLIEGIRPTSASAMPEGLVDVLDEQEIADLVAYLLAGGRS